MHGRANAGLTLAGFLLTTFILADSGKMLSVDYAVVATRWWPLKIVRNVSRSLWLTLVVAMLTICSVAIRPINGAKLCERRGAYPGAGISRLHGARRRKLWGSRARAPETLPQSHEVPRRAASNRGNSHVEVKGSASCRGTLVDQADRPEDYPQTFAVSASTSVYSISDSLRFWRRDSSPSISATLAVGRCTQKYKWLIAELNSAS